MGERVEALESRVVLAQDFGDAPDTGAGTGAGNYETLLASGGPRHTIVAGLFLGGRVDGEADATQNARANGDDTTGAPPGDEGGVVNPLADLMLTTGTQPTITLRATNTTGTTATLFGWIDLNNNGVFDNAGERAQATVPTSTNSGTFTLTFPVVSTGFTGRTYARFRLSTDTAAQNPTGAALDGEVEDYAVTVTRAGVGTVKTNGATKLASGGNSIPTLTGFGRSVANVGDLDGNGVTDLAVGSDGDNTGVSNRGAVHILFLDASGAVTSSTTIASETGGGPTLANGARFGSSLANLGDLDGDGVTDLAVGAPAIYGGGDQGAVHILFLEAGGTVKSKTKIANGIGGGPTLVNNAGFGRSMANLGDLDGDGVTDLAVLAERHNTFGVSYVAVHILFLNADGTAKSSTKISSGYGVVPLIEGSGASVANIGDLDGDGVTDLAVGAPRDSAGGSLRGAIHILFLKPDGTAKSSTKIASGTGGGPMLANLDEFGSSLANVGDLDGDGVGDLAVGALGDDGRGNDRGAVHILFLNASGTVKSSTKIASGTGGGPRLADSDIFGSAVANVGDLDGDGVTDLAIGAPSFSFVGVDRGAVHILRLTDSSIVIPVLPQVRMVYIVPSDRSENPTYVAAMATAIQSLQRWYSQQLGNGKTFSLSSPIVEVVFSTRSSSWFSTNNPVGTFTFFNNGVSEGFSLTDGKFDDPDNRWIFYIDADLAPGQSGAGGNGVAVVHANDLRGLAGEQQRVIDANEPVFESSSRINRWIGGLGHELGHAFGLPHPDPSFDLTALMWTGYTVYPETGLVPDDKQLLNSSAFFSTAASVQLNTNSSPILDSSGAPYAIFGVGSRQSTEMRQGVLVSDILARGAGGNPISDPDTGAVKGIAVTALDTRFGSFQFTLVTNNPQESDWSDFGTVTDTSAVLLPDTARARLITGLIPHHDSGVPFLPLESKLDSGITFRAWDRTSGTAGQRGNTTNNGVISAFSTASETVRVYFEARLFRHFNQNAGLNVYTLEAEFNAIAAGLEGRPAFQDRSTSGYTGFTVLLSAVPELGTSPLYRLYYGVQFNPNGTQTDMGYRYLTSNLAEAEVLENNVPDVLRARREGTYFRELGVGFGSAILGYVFTAQQAGTSSLTQIYRTDIVDKPTRLSGTNEGDTPTFFIPQENGDHVYTTNTAFEVTKPGTWRIEATRGFVRELTPNPVAAPATAAATESIGLTLSVGLRSTPASTGVLSVLPVAADSSVASLLNLLSDSGETDDVARLVAILSHAPVVVSPSPTTEPIQAVSAIAQPRSSAAMTIPSLQATSDTGWSDVAFADPAFVTGVLTAI